MLVKSTSIFPNIKCLESVDYAKNELEMPVFCYSESRTLGMVDG